ncbi:tyrosine-type recombinase/integrase [Mesorhizobium sp. VNQ89]|uniref:tyrosine-type recombinase/integrase n=1 Tax=Mesorhizobium quangtriensis TaxID=3157709 RepID=UPI0032B711BE
MSARRLTKRVVDDAQPLERRYTVFDTDIRGFGLRVFPSGEKSWIYEYRSAEGGRRAAKKRVTLGSTKKLTADQARSEAERLRARVNLGDDPQRSKARERVALTVAELAKAFMDDHVRAKRKTATVSSYEGTIERYILPALGAKKAKDISRTDVARIHVGLRATPALANRTLAILGSMFSFAFRHGLTETDIAPSRGIPKFRELHRERFLSTSELEQLGNAIRQAETVGIPWPNAEHRSKHHSEARSVTHIGEHVAAALRLLVFTGARLREILHLKWENVDLERGLLLLPDSKTGRKTIVLGAPAIEVLGGLTRVGSYVIAGDGAGRPDERPRSDLKRPWSLVTRHAGLPGLRIHDLRHSFASFGVAAGMSLPVLGKLLGHSQPQTTARYAHLDADPLRRSANAVNAMMNKAIGREEPSPTPSRG